jgi:hypothetical protein
MCKPGDQPHIFVMVLWWKCRNSKLWDNNNLTPLLRLSLVQFTLKYIWSLVFRKNRRDKYVRKSVRKIIKSEKCGSFGVKKK